MFWIGLIVGVIGTVCVSLYVSRPNKSPEPLITIIEQADSVRLNTDRIPKDKGFEKYSETIGTVVYVIDDWASVEWPAGCDLSHRWYLEYLVKVV